MAYTGKYQPINTDKYKGDHRNIVFRSLWELACFKWADTNTSVRNWSSEEVVIPYIYDIDKKPHRYYIDLKLVFNDGKTFIIEIKPEKETKKPEFKGRKTRKYLAEGKTYIKNQNKWKYAKKYAEDRGWKFIIWTEVDLEKMGILPKKAPSVKKSKAFPAIKISPKYKKAIKPFPKFEKTAIPK